MTAILAFLGTKAGLAILAGGGLLGGFFGPKIVKGMVSKYVGNALHIALDPKTQDPVKKQLIVEFVKAGIKLVEYCTPDRGGALKKDAVVKMLAQVGGGVIPSSVQNALGNMVQEVFDTMDDELNKIAP